MEEKSQVGLGQWLDEERQRQGLSLREVSRKTGLSHTTIADIIKGKHPSGETIKRLAKAFSGDGYHRTALEDKLLTLAGFRSQHQLAELSEPLAKLVDKVKHFSEKQLELLSHFTDFLNEMEDK